MKFFLLYMPVYSKPGSTDPERMYTMPECYTHAYIGTKALMRSGLTAASQPAFLAGVNGPDPLYMYKKFKPRPQPNLPALASVMHREATGKFLLALIQRAITPVQQSYVMGFLTHYTTDCTLYPYLAAMSRKGMPYEGANGHRRMETSLDSSLYYQDYKTYLVPVHAGTPVLITEDLAQVTTLLLGCIKDVYNEDIPAVALADTFHDNLAMRRFLLTRTGLRRALATVLGFHYRDKRGKYSIACRMQPGKPLKRLPDTWTNPYTDEELNITMDEVLAIAEQTGAVCITAAMHYWLGEIDEAQLSGILGNNNYYTGLPNEPVKAPAAREGEKAPAAVDKTPAAVQLADEATTEVPDAG